MSQTLYKDTLRTVNNRAGTAAQNEHTTRNLLAKGSKVNRICDAFLATLEKRLDTNLHNLITAHVCKSPPDLEAGLRLVARLRGKGLKDNWSEYAINGTVEQTPDQAEDAIEHMCFLTDANLLYIHALGLYDLELTLLVAQQAQKVGDFSKIYDCPLVVNCG